MPILQKKIKNVKVGCIMILNCQHILLIYGMLTMASSPSQGFYLCLIQVSGRQKEADAEVDLEARQKTALKQLQGFNTMSCAEANEIANFRVGIIGYAQEILT